MDKDQAVREVLEIKQIMENSRKKPNRSKYWIFPAIALVALVVCGIVPVFTPFIAIAFIVGGLVTWRRSSDSILKGTAAGIVAVGIVLLILTLIVIFGIMGYHASSTTVITPTP
jgi:protein-S-isoprenylcysteine O-methyltransferase Ste14